VKEDEGKNVLKRLSWLMRLTQH